MFVRTFEAPNSPEVTSFWVEIVRRPVDIDCGYKTITGWILGFCFWNIEGKPLVDRCFQNLSESRDKTYNSALADTEWWKVGKEFWWLDWHNVPSCYAYVPVHLELYGVETKIITMIGGSLVWERRDSDTIFLETRQTSKQIAEGSASLSEPTWAVPRSHSGMEEKDRKMCAHDDDSDSGASLMKPAKWILPKNKPIQQIVSSWSTGCLAEGHTQSSRLLDGWPLNRTKSRKRLYRNCQYDSRDDTRA